MMLKLKLLRIKNISSCQGEKYSEQKNYLKCVHGEYESKYAMTSYVSLPTVVFDL